MLAAFVVLLCGLTPGFGQTVSFSNASAITIPDSGAGAPYPSTINVSGTAGTISQAGVQFAIQASSDINTASSSWVTLATITNSTGVTPFSDSTTNSLRYYRAKQL